MKVSTAGPSDVFTASGTPPAQVEAFSVDLSTLLEAKRNQLAQEVVAFKIRWHHCPLKEWPAEWRSRQELDLSDSPALERLPEGLAVSVLALRNCTALTALPKNLKVDFLDISGCTSLRAWEPSAQVFAGRVIARDCTGLERLPEKLGPVTSLDISGCRAITEIPPGIEVRSFVDIAGTGITSLPESLQKIPLRWRGVNVNARIAFFPESLTAEEALNEPNAEVRRVIIERMGFERFLAEAKATTIHTDRDAGGPRRLLSVALPNDEPLVVVSVSCPSTGRHYLIRVPPAMQTCHAAVAWTAGFDNPDDYQPLAET